MTDQGKQDLVRYHLHRALVEVDEPRDPEVIHASDLTGKDYCPREQVLRRVTGKGRETPLTASQSLTFATGRDNQRLVTRLLARLRMVVGDWECLACGHVEHFQKRPAGCLQCGLPGTRQRYREVRFTSRANGASCGVDLFVQLPGRDLLTVVEVKGEQKSEFQALQMVRGEHRARASLYLRIIAESGHPAKKLVDTQEARVLYVCKGGYGQKDEAVKEWRLGDGQWSPFKEYAVARDDAGTEPYAQLAAQVTRYGVDETVPNGVCPTQFVRRAKGCAVVHECFSGRWPWGGK